MPIIGEVICVAIVCCTITMFAVGGTQEPGKRNTNSDATRPAVLDVSTGKRQATWKVSGATSLGHSLAEETAGTVLVIDSGAGRLMRVGSNGIKNWSPCLGKEISEASLAE